MSINTLAMTRRAASAFEGRLSITSVEQRRIGSEESTQIKGNWELRKVGTQEKIGPQEGSGDLIGSIIEGEIYINLNPNISDANVNLRGTIEGKRFYGKWSFDGCAGAISRGTFEATGKWDSPGPLSSFFPAVYNCGP